jgi:hypothetical protein
LHLSQLNAKLTFDVNINIPINFFINPYGKVPG